MTSYNTNWIQAKSYQVEREIKENTQKYRNNFQKDRDRILYSKSFRRLSGKTQVFLSGQNDHLRTRLTHSLEVSQIARTISNALGLNLDLTEAIALGHDIGHTPFGHIGERTLNFIMNGCEKIKDFNTDLAQEEKGFKHNVHALRILNSLEKSKEQYDGLNITNQTLWGIVNHTKYENIDCKRYKFLKEKQENIDCYFDRKVKECSQKGLLYLDFYNKYLNKLNDKTSWNFEGLVVRISDEIAQRHHDIEDGIFTGLLNKSDIVDIIENNFTTFFDAKTKIAFLELKELKNIELLSSYVSRFIVNTLINRVITDSRDHILKLYKKYNIKNSNDFFIQKEIIYNNENIYTFINFNIEFAKKDKEIQEYLENKILNSFAAQKMDGKAEYIIRKLFEAFVSNPQQLPDSSLLFFFTDFLEKEKIEGIKTDFPDDKFIGGLRYILKNNYYRNDTPGYKHALLRTICDYIAGMTDNFAYNQFELLYGSTRMFY